MSSKFWFPSMSVAEIVDADPWAEVPWIATRYVPGLSLHDHVLEEGPLRGADLLWFAGCLAEGLDAVHAAGVLHRDVKPSNVLMEGRTPILIDFGLAKLLDELSAFPQQAIRSSSQHRPPLSRRSKISRTDSNSRRSAPTGSGLPANHYQRQPQLQGSRLWL